MSPGASNAAETRDTPTGAQPVFTQDAFNVFRRFEAHHSALIVNFYHQALGLERLTPVRLSETEEVTLFKFGAGQIKLAAGLKQGRAHHLGEINGATGIRLFTLRYTDVDALIRQFGGAGFAAPDFRDIGNGQLGALVTDPAGFWIQLIVDPSATISAGVDVGINVSDLTRSRAFYQQFVGLEPLEPVEDPMIGATKYPFRLGETIISLWSSGSDLRADTGSAGLQYVIANIDQVNARALEHAVTVEEPLGGLPNLKVRFLWLNDPDGVTNYFAQVGGT